MALTLAQLQAKRDTLIAAIGEGARSIQFEGRSVTYNSIEDMLKAVSYLDSQIESSGGAERGGRFSYGTFSRG